MRTIDLSTKWNDRPLPPSRLERNRQAQRPHYNAATGFTLFAQSPCPCGEHFGKDMARIPVADLYRYLRTPSLARFPEWAPVIEYCRVNEADITARYYA